MDFRYVYIMKSNKGFYKIGISNDPYRRVKEVGHAPKLLSQYRFLYTEKVEKLLHRMFEKKRKVRTGSGKTEWFQLRWHGHLRLKIVITVFKLIHDGLILTLLVLICVLLLWLFKGGFGQILEVLN